MSPPIIPNSLFIALGGNAITPPHEEGTQEQQFARTRTTMQEIVRAIGDRYPRLVISHGNGPQVGEIILRCEIAAATVPPLPLDSCVADSEGQMGYMIQQLLGNVLAEQATERAASPESPASAATPVPRPRPVVTVLTQTVVASDDPAWTDPTKFIGRDYTEDEAKELMATKGWRLKPQAKRGWRRVVPSPAAVHIVEASAVSALLDSGAIVIAVGGGGIPVIRDEQGRLHGVEAVIDKDLASALLAAELGIETLAILTGVDQVALDFGKPSERYVPKLPVAEAEQHLADGQFPPGSMGPKIRAALNFVRAGGGRKCLITSSERLQEALAGTSGTWLVG